MITAIEFKNEKFADRNFSMYELTNNTVIICENKEIKDTLFGEIRDICLDKHLDFGYGYHQYDANSKLNITKRLQYYPSSIIEIDKEQVFYFSIEAPFVYRATNVKDIWFALFNENNEVELFALTDFKGHKDIWEKGIDNVYEYLVSGRFFDYKYQGNVD